MNNMNRKFYLITVFFIIATCIILELIFNLIFQHRDLIEGLVYAISFGLVFFITWSVAGRFWKRKKEKKKIKSSKF